MEEDVALCRAYARSAAENPTDFLGRMCFLFAESAPDEDEPDRWAHRSNKALEKRLKVIRPAVLRFCRHYGRAVANAKPNDGEANIIAQALASYAGARTNDKLKGASHPDNSFKYLECWHTLRNVPVFAGACKANDKLPEGEIKPDVVDVSGPVPGNYAAGADVQINANHRNGSAVVVAETKSFIDGSEETTTSNPSGTRRIDPSAYPNLVAETLATTSTFALTSGTEGLAVQRSSSDARLVPQSRKRARTTLAADKLGPPACLGAIAGAGGQQQATENGRHGAHGAKKVSVGAKRGNGRAPPAKTAAATVAASRPPRVEANAVRENRKDHFLLSENSVSQLVAMGEKLVCIGEEMCGIAVFSRQDATPSRRRQYFDLLELRYLEALKRSRAAESVAPEPGSPE
jgi:hypothetical protein